MKVELSPLAASIARDGIHYVKQAYALEFTPDQLVSAVLAARGIEGIAETFGILFAQVTPQQTDELDLESDAPPVVRPAPSQA